jgi:hypothetical protein
MGLALMSVAVDPLITGSEPEVSQVALKLWPWH